MSGDACESRSFPVPAPAVGMMTPRFGVEKLKLSSRLRLATCKCEVAGPAESQEGERHGGRG